VTLQWPGLLGAAQGAAERVVTAVRQSLRREETVKACGPGHRRLPWYCCASDPEVRGSNPHAGPRRGYNDYSAYIPRSACPAAPKSGRDYSGRAEPRALLLGVQKHLLPGEAVRASRTYVATCALGRSCWLSLAQQGPTGQLSTGLQVLGGHLWAATGLAHYTRHTLMLRIQQDPVAT
jgi:hypothetical protein